MPIIANLDGARSVFYKDSGKEFPWAPNGGPVRARSLPW